MFKFKLDRKVFDGSPKKWKKEGASYKLLNPDLEKDKCYFEASIKEITAPQFDIEKDVLSIAGIANANIVDRVDERLDPRGIELANFVKNPQILAHHDYRNPVGQVEELEIEEGGISFAGWIGDPKKAPLTDKQKEIRSLVKQGILKTVSVGFIPKKVKAPLFNDDGSVKEGPVIEQWELLEISVVAVPCNQDSVFSIRGLENSKEGDNFNSNTNEDPMKIKNSLNNTTDSSTKKDDAVVSKEDKPREDNTEDTFKGDVITLLRGLDAGLKRSLELTEKLVAKSEEKVTDEEEEEETTVPSDEEGCKPPKDDEDKKKLVTEIEELKKVNEKLSKQVEELTCAVALLVKDMK